MTEPQVTWPQVLAWRMRRQLLDPVGQVEARDVVRCLCGVQAQVPAAAALAIGVRQADPVPGAVDRALADGRLMRAWAMRSGPGTAATEILAPERRPEVSRAGGWITPVVVAAGRVAGVWDRDRGEIDVRPFGSGDGSGDGDAVPAAALDAAVERMREVVSALDPG